MQYFNLTDLFDRILDIIVGYVVTSMNIAYLLFAILCYAVMLMKLIKSHQRFQNSSSSSSSSSSCSKIYQIIFRTKFSMSILIITSYLLFTIVPNVTDSVWVIAFNSQPQRTFKKFNHFYRISLRFSCTIDALIYIFLHPKIKELVAKRICCSQNERLQMKLSPGVRRARDKRRHEEMELVLMDEQN